MRQLKISESITNRDNRSLTVYLQDVSKYALLSAEEEVLLAAKIRDGDSIALNRLVSANLRFVISVAKQYQHQGLVLEDLINEGNLGLVKAATRFDATKGFKFISYAVWWIRQSIVSAISTQCRIVRLPGNQVADVIRVKRSQSALEQQLEREPSIEELAAALDFSPQKVKQSLSNAEKQISMDAPSLLSEDICLADSLPGEDPPTDHRAIGNSLRGHIEQLLEKLPHRERLILTMFYGLQGGEQKNLEEIGGLLGLTPERIRQIKIKALIQIQKSSWGKKLLAQLD